MPLDPRRFRAPFIPPETVWEQADRFRNEHWGRDIVPVEVEEILWGVGLRLEPLQSLKEAADIDALLRGDLTAIIVDADEYMDDRMQNRIRFSIAHELGHYVLHAELYRRIRYRSVEEWIEFVQALPDDQWSFVEQQAYEFAGRLLVPRERPESEVRSAKHRALKAGFVKWDRTGDAAVEYLAVSICRVFGVSDQVIARRIRRERLWPLTGPA